MGSSADAEPRTLVVVADDFGLTPGVCDGVLRAHRHGIVTTTSVLANGPALEDHADELRRSGLPVGIHLTLVGEDPPVLDAGAIPTLVDSAGRFPATWKALIGRLTLGRINPDDVRREMDSQVQRVRELGLTPGHVDTHQHIHLWPSIREAVLDVAEREGISAIRVPASRRIDPASVGVRVLARRLTREAADRSFRTAGSSAGYDGSGSMTTDRLVATIDALAASGSDACELWTHPGTADDPSRARYRWGYRWSEELDALCSPEARRAVERSGFVLGTYGDIGSAGR